METLRTICSDIARDLKQRKDDAEISEMQLWYWTLTTADRMRMQHIAKRKSGAFLTTFVLPVQTDPVFTDRQFISLPVSIYDYDLDGGVESISYFAPTGSFPEYSRVIMFRTDPSTYRSRHKSFYQRASPTMPYFEREHEKFYFLGPDFQLENVEVKLYTNLPDILSVDPDAVFDFPKELLYVLKRAVIDEGRWALSLPGQYLQNDGTNRPAQQASGDPGKTVSVNSELLNSNND